MFVYTTGDLLKSPSEALVNTVNCEGYMGKGIAYQFKLQFPETNNEYVRACKNGTLKIGKLHYFREKGKIIVNFPTKDKWRANSKMEYVEKGLDALIPLIEELNIKSISIPPLGSGNGGLIWADVKTVIEKKLSNLANSVDIYIYEPSKNYTSQPTIEPKLSVSALVLMEIKHLLKQFNKLRLQKAAYFINVFSGENYFNFKRHTYGPYDNSIAIISRNIKEYQKYHGVKSTNEARTILYNKIVSKSVNEKLLELMPPIKKACVFVNAIEDDHELECLSTIVFLIEESGALTNEMIVQKFKAWSQDKADRFPENEIIQGIERLYLTGIIEETLVGYKINSDHQDFR